MYIYIYETLVMLGKIVRHIVRNVGILYNNVKIIGNNNLVV